MFLPLSRYIYASVSLSVHTFLYLSVSVYNCGGAFVWVCVCSLHHAVRLLCSQCLVQ